MTKLYIVNKLDNELTLKSGFLNIPAKGFAAINEFDKTESTVLYALGRDWIEITETQPEAVKVEEKTVDITVVEPYKGMTEEELKAAQAAEKEAPAVEAAKGVALGVEESAKEETPAKGKKGK